MSLKELLSLEEAVPCPGCPVCEPRVSRKSNRPKSSRHEPYEVRLTPPDEKSGWRVRERSRVEPP